MNKYVCIAAVLSLSLAGIVVGQEYNEAPAILSPYSSAEIPQGSGQSVAPDQGLRPVVPPSENERMAARDKEAVQQQTQESLLYGVAAGGANPNLIQRAGEQSSQDSPQEGNP
ncbi:MAG TPA: hypothetical protein ENH12_07300, partial [Proteobacteria bacterium]|nr:hypothetical protein [Pseudomonadota bacterium]